MICAVHSTISSGLNSLAAVCLQDLLQLICFKDMMDQRATLVSKIICMCPDDFEELAVVYLIFNVTPIT